MPLKNGHMTAKERVFVGHMARTGDSVYAATKAGYATPENRGPEKARTLSAAVRAEYDELITTELLPLAYTRLKRTLESDTTPAGAANQAVKLVLEHAYSGGGEAGDKDASEMTADEIAARIKALEAMQEAIASKAKDVTPAGVFD